jgi:ferric-dicitrate binding protein FerR (iron transport regulator)
VAKDSLSPFVIQCGELFTTVLGTSFNIKSTEENIEVVVLTGKVALTSQNDKKGVIVLPNEKAMYLVGSRQIAKAEKEVEKEEARAAISGTEYKMDFKDTRMKEVIKRIEGKFNVVVQTDDPKLLNCMITADFSGQSLERTLDMMAIVLAFDYEIKDGTVVLTGAGCPK